MHGAPPTAAACEPGTVGGMDETYFDVVIDDDNGHTTDRFSAVDLPAALSAAFAADDALVTVDATFADGGRWQVSKVAS